MRTSKVNAYDEGQILLITCGLLLHAVTNSTVSIKIFVDQYTLFTKMEQALLHVVNSELSLRVT